MNERNGFTLIETLAACALAALLLLVALQVVGSVGRSQRTMTRRDDATAWADGVLDVIRADVLNARHVTVADGELRIDGYNALDPATLRPSNRPARVIYRVRPIAGRPWLARSQTRLDDLTNAATTTQPLCPDVAALAVVATRDLAAEPDAMPARVAVRLTSTDPAATAVEEVIYVK